MQNDITHKEIYDRLIQSEKKFDHLDQKVDRIDENTQDVVRAFQSAKGAFVVLDFIGKLAKPVLWVVAVGSAIAFLWSEWLRR